MSTKFRTFVKSFVWRIISTIITLALIYYITGNLAVATTIAIINFFLKLVLFYYYDRVWDKVHWGRIDR